MSGEFGILGGGRRVVYIVLCCGLGCFFMDQVEGMV